MAAAMLLGATVAYTMLRGMDSDSARDMETSLPAASGAPVSAAQGQARLAPIHFYDSDGDQVSLADFEGEVLLVNLWATWCPPCVAELPSLDTLQAKLGDRGLHVIAISMDTKPVGDVAAFLAARNVEQIALYIDSDRQIPMKWPYTGIPASFLIGRDGRIIESFEGPREWHEGAVFDKIAAQLD